MNRNLDEPLTRWSPCEVDPEAEDGPVFQGFLADPAGAWVKWQDVVERGRKPYEAPAIDESLDLGIETDVSKWVNVSGVPIFPGGTVVNASSSGCQVPEFVSAPVGSEIDSMLAGIEVCEGKYRFYLRKNDWRVFVQRHGQEWLTIEDGRRAVLALMMEVEDLREEVKELERNLQNERDEADNSAWERSERD